MRDNSRDPMSDPAAPGPRPRIRDRFHALCSAALQAIPVVGHDAAEFFENRVTPRVKVPRDRVFDFLGRLFGVNR